MMTKPRYMKPFTEQELKVLGTKPGFFPGMAPSYIFNTPISYRENVMNTFMEKRPCFAVSNRDFTHMNCDYFQAHLGRGGRANPNFTDAFGVKWTFEPTAGGSISVGGNPRFVDVNDWKDAIKMPDVNDWDWAADAEKNKVNTDFAVLMTPTNGFWFERLISLMDFMNAAMALVDEDQYDALHELFEATTQLGCDMIDKICEYWPSVDGFTLHDDWGSQREPFFSDEVARELFLPHMKKLVGHIHDKGRFCMLHSCGHIEDRLPVLIEAGLDSWEMQANANDIYKCYEKYGDQIVLQVTIPEFDPNDEKACVQAARDYVDNFCKPGKPTMILSRNGMGSKVFAEELYTYSRKHFMNW